jgi:hypothetical protein
VPDES